MRIHFTEDAWEDYLYWQGQDKKTLKRINKIIKDMQRHPFEGIAKPEPLKYDYQGAWSRRIDAENRLIYMVEADQLYILSLKDEGD
ncbi:TPA: Txe/YoeB family addiction module toxin [Streptococcus suis]|nr:Txe/YoeB family addiction module toxin [Streptococcus suis]